MIIMIIANTMIGLGLCDTIHDLLECELWV
jgi:hypothetical protein